MAVQPKEIPKHFDVVTLPGRFAASLSILDWVGIALALAHFYWPVMRLAGFPANGWCRVSFCLPTSRCVDHRIPSIIGQYYFHRGSTSRRRQEQQAIANYRKAMSWDCFYTTGIEVYNLIGQLQRQAGSPARPRALLLCRSLRAEYRMSRPSWSCNAWPRRTLLWPKKLAMKPCEFGPTGVWPAIKLAQSETRSQTGRELSTRTRKGGRLNPSLLSFTCSLISLEVIICSAGTNPD